jgi:hypothetical protein
MHLLGALFFEYSFQGEIEGFASQLSAEHEEDFDFAGRPDEGRIDHAEALRDKSQPGAEVRYWITWILKMLACVEELGKPRT